MPGRGMTKKKRARRRAAWGLVAAGAAYIASRGTESLLDKGWERTRGKKPPRDPLARGTSWPVVIGWAAATAALVGVSQVLAQRGAAFGWKRVVGSEPPRF